ncbi:MAG: hypothetical protein H0X26_00305 [Alphaproteobacteria bacterium]|nr:hypothetical protein [Alphaproteobacteria bacterium]
MKLKSILKQTTALTLSLTLYVTGSIAMETELKDSSEDGKSISFQTKADASSIQLEEVNSKEITSSYKSFFNMSRELSLYNESCKAVQDLLSEEFKNSLNNVLTWVAYNESKRLYIKHSDKFVSSLASSLIDINFALVKHLTLKAVGLKDVVKAVSILTGEDLSPEKKPSQYISENYSGYFFDLCRLKFATDALNEKVIAPYLVGPSVAYAVHKADAGGLVQQYLFNHLQKLLEEKKPEMVQKAEQSIKNLEAEHSRFIKKITDLTQKIDSLENSEEVLKLKQQVAENGSKLKDKEEELTAQNQIIENEAKEMTMGQYLWNCLPRTSTENQIKAQTLKAELVQYGQEKVDLKSRLAIIRQSLKNGIKTGEANAEELKTEINAIKKTLELMNLPPENQQSKSIKVIKALFEGFSKSRSKEVDRDLSIGPDFAGMAMEEMLKPCPYIEYRFLKLLGDKNPAAAKGHEESNETLKLVCNTLIQSTKKMGELYLDFTGITRAVTRLKIDISQETLTKNVNEVIKLYENGQATFSERNQERVEILEKDDAYKVTKAIYIGRSYIHQAFNASSTLMETGFVIKNYATRLQDDALSLGNSVRTAVRPITIAVKTLKYSPSVWAVHYLGSCALGVSLPYSTGFALVLGVMEDYELWAPVTEQVISVKNSIASKFQG